MRVLVILCAGLFGCYHPNIKDGTIYCGADGACPTGLTCAGDGLCYAHPPTITPYGDGHLGSPTLASTGDIVLDTDTGEITQQNTTTGGETIIVPASSQAFGTPQSQGPAVAIWSFSSLTIPAGITVRVSPDSRNVPVLATTGVLTVNGNIDVSGNGGINGGVAESAPNPDGATTGGGGGAMTGDAGGGGGGGHAAVGQPGMATGGGVGGAMYGAADLPIYFGAGGGGGSATDTTGSAGLGGTGGGAIALLGATVDVEGTVSVNGRDGGSAAGTDAGGGGGGAGGIVLVSGGNVTIGANAVLTAVGGNGGMASGAGGAGGNGANGVVWLLGSLTNHGMTMPTPPSTAAALTKFPQ